MFDPARVESVFLEAQEQPSAAERAACLDRACGGDLSLRRRVERLLECHDAAGDFLETPLPAAMAAEALARGISGFDDTPRAAGRSSGARPAQEST